MSIDPEPAPDTKLLRLTKTSGYNYLRTDCVVALASTQQHFEGSL